MAHPPIYVLGYSEAAMLLRGAGGAEVQAVISVCSRDEFPVEVSESTRQLILHFDDVDAATAGDPLGAYRSWVRKKWDAEVGRPQSPPTADHAKAIIDFAHDLKDADGTVLCHCQGGVSRSSAAALLCLAVWMGEGQEQQCVEHLLHIRPCAMPHPGLIAFGDHLLGRKGKLVAAVMKRGTC